MFKIKPTKQSLLGLVVVAVLILAGSVSIYLNTSGKLAALQAKVKSGQDALANSQRTARRLTDVEQEYNDDMLKLNILERGVSSKAYVPTLLRQLEELGRSSNLKVVGVRPKLVELPPAPPAPAANGQAGVQTASNPAPKPDPYDKLNVDIEADGKYWDVVRFLGKITSFPKIIAVNSIQILPVSDIKNPGSPKLNVKLGTTAFVLKEGEASKSSEKKVDSGSTSVRS